MTDSNWDTSIQDVLIQLNKTAWRAELNALCDRFDGIDSPTSIRSDIELSLWQLVKLAQTSESKVIPIARLFHRRLSEMECWMHRAVSTSEINNDDPQFWNPLDQYFRDFVSDSTHQYTAACPYPAQDVIRKWCESRFP